MIDIERYIHAMIRDPFSTKSYPLEEYLKSIELSTLRQKIDDFDYDNLAMLEDSEIIRSIDDVLGTDKSPIKFAGMFEPYVIPPSRKFCRVRRLSNSHPPFVDLCCEDRLWEAPAHLAGIGRFNEQGVSLLYCSWQEMTVAAKEARVQVNDTFCTIVYENQEELRLYDLCSHYRIPDYLASEENIEKSDTIIRFINKLLYRPSDSVSASTYRITNLILRHRFPLIGDDWDGWIYQSVVAKGGLNIAFMPLKARHKLKVKAVSIWKALEHQGKREPFKSEYCSTGEFTNENLHFLSTDIPMNREYINNHINGVPLASSAYLKAFYPWKALST